MSNRPRSSKGKGKAMEEESTKKHDRRTPSTSSSQHQPNRKKAKEDTEAEEGDVRSDGRTHTEVSVPVDDEPMTPEERQEMIEKQFKNWWITRTWALTGGVGGRKAINSAELFAHRAVNYGAIGVDLPKKGNPQ